MTRPTPINYSTLWTELKGQPSPTRPQARTFDPDTSRACESVDKASRAALVVRQVMADGVARTDEEIARAAQTDLTPDRLRHGRLWLVDQGELVDTGERRVTESGAKGRVWRKA